MKGKFLALAGSLLIINNSYAFEMLKQEITCTGKNVTSCGYLEGPEAEKKMAEMKRVKKNSPNIASDNVVLGTCVQGKSCKVMNYLKIDSTHSYSITNVNPFPIDLQLHYNLHSVYGDMNNLFWIRLGPGERHDATGYTFLTIQPDKTGQTQMTSLTEVMVWGNKATDSTYLSVSK